MLNNRDKIRARSQVAIAIANGKLVRPELCDICLRFKKVEAHHEDYSKPLEINWFCHKCHTSIFPRDTGRKRKYFKNPSKPWLCAFCLFGLYSKTHLEVCPKATIEELLELRKIVYLE